MYESQSFLIKIPPFPHNDHRPTNQDNVLLINPSTLILFARQYSVYLLREYGLNWLIRSTFIYRIVVNPREWHGFVMKVGSIVVFFFSFLSRVLDQRFLSINVITRPPWFRKFLPSRFFFLFFSFFQFEIKLKFLWNRHERWKIKNYLKMGYFVQYACLSIKFYNTLIFTSFLRKFV